MWRIAMSSLSAPSAPSEARFGQADEMREAVGGDAGDVPEEIELGDALETRQRREPCIRERSVDQQVCAVRFASVVRHNIRTSRARSFSLGKLCSSGRPASVTSLPLLK